MLVLHIKSFATRTKSGVAYSVVNGPRFKTSLFQRACTRDNRIGSRSAGP